MKALLINGSPHEHGCTYTALRELADTLEAEGIETEIIQAGKTAHACNACASCKKTHRCVYDDLVNETAPKLAAADAESRTVTVGVRPVHVTVGDEGIDAQIDVSELMGSELHLHMTAGGKDVVAVVQTANLDPNAYARHTAVKFSFEPRLIHLFDPETEKNLI